jgi:uncharacterized membrane protein
MDKLKNFNENKNKGVSHAKGHIVISESYEGQLPSPDMMQKYNQLDSTFADRILKMTEKEQDHNHKINERTSRGLMISMIAGMVFAFSSVLVVSYLVYFCIVKGFPSAAGTIAVGVIVGIAGVFMYQRKKINTP